MRIWSSGQVLRWNHWHAGWNSNNTRSIPCGCVYWRTSWPSTVQAVLLLFAPFCNVSCLRCANPKCESLRAVCSTFTLGTVLQYHPWSMTAITTLRFAQTREIDLNTFLKGFRSSQFFWSPDHNSNDSYLIVYPDQASKLSKAWAVTLLILPASLAMEATTGQRIFLLWCLFKKVFWAKLFVFLWQKVEDMLVKAVSSISIHQIWILRITGFSSRILFPHILGFLYQNWKKISAFTLLNHGRAYAIKKSILSCPYTCISILGPVQTLKSPFCNPKIKLF